MSLSRANVIQEQFLFDETANPYDRENVNPTEGAKPHLEQWVPARCSDVDMGNITPLNTSNVQYLMDANIDCDINEFFDLDNAALESPTHGLASVEPFFHDKTALETPPQPAPNGESFTSSKRPRAGFELETQDYEAQAAIRPQLSQSDKNSRLNISNTVRMIYSPRDMPLALTQAARTYGSHLPSVSTLR